MTKGQAVGKLLKILISVVVVVLGLVAVMAVALLFLVDPNDYKDQIASQVETHTGRTLSIEGDMALSIFPWLGLDIGRTRLSNAEGFGDEPMARMDAVQVRVKLLPLLRKTLEMDTLKLSGLQLNLAKKADGSTNWDDLTGAPAEDKDKDEAVSPGDDAGGDLLGGLAIGGVEVTGAQLIWDDQSTASRYEVRELSFTTGAIEPGDLLTTSSTPGHAMRVDFGPAGAVIGKALEPLPDGTGTIRVLVAPR